MALQLGALYVSLSARTSAFSKSMAGAMKTVERFAKETKRVAAEVAQVSGILAAVGGAAVKMAASVDGPTKAAMAGLEKSTQLLAVQVADMLLPAVREMASMFKSAAGYVAGLDPEVKKHIASFAVLAVQLAFAAKALSLFSGLAANVFGVLRAGFGMVASIGAGPLLGIIAAVGLVIGAVLLLHRAWRKNWGGIQDIVKEVLQWLRDAFSQLATFFGKFWDFLVDGAANFVEGLLSVIDTVQEITGKKLIDTAGMREGFGGLWKDLKSGSFFSEAFTFGKSIGQQLVDGIKEEWAAIKSELSFDGPKKGQTIGLGRGMGSPQSDISGHAFMADESMRALKMAEDAAARELAKFRKSLSDVQFDVEMRKWLKGLNSIAVGGATKSGMATVDLGDRAITSGRFGGAMRPTTAGIRGDIGAAGAADAAAKTAQAMDAAVGAANWGAATRVLDEGLGKAADVGQSLELWGKRMAGLLGAAGKQILGAVGDLADSVIQGAQQGGVWGAIIAAFMEIAKKTASALRFLDVAMEFIEELAAMVEPLVKPIFEALTDLLGGILSMIGPLFTALQPFFDAVGKLIENLGPVLSAIGYLVQALAPIIEVIGKIVGVIVEALKPVFELIAGVIKVIATVILGIIIALNEIAGAFGDEAAKAESARLKGIIDKMWAPGSAEAEAADRAAAAARLRAAADEEAAGAAQKVAESLSNVPAGFNIANARYRADLGITSANAYAAGGGAGDGGVTINGDVHVTSSSDTIGGVAADAKKEAARERGQREGNPRPNRSGSGGRNG